MVVASVQGELRLTLRRPNTTSGEMTLNGVRLQLYVDPSSMRTEYGWQSLPVRANPAPKARWLAVLTENNLWSTKNFTDAVPHFSLHADRWCTVPITGYTIDYRGRCLRQLPSGQCVRREQNIAEITFTAPMEINCFSAIFSQNYSESMDIGIWYFDGAEDVKLYEYRRTTLTHVVPRRLTAAEAAPQRSMTESERRLQTPLVDWDIYNVSLHLPWFPMDTWTCMSTYTCHLYSLEGTWQHPKDRLLLVQVPVDFTGTWEENNYRAGTAGRGSTIERSGVGCSS